MQRCIRISEICTALKLAYKGKDIEINGLNLCNRDSEHDKVLSYVTSENYIGIVKNNKAVVAVVVSQNCLEIYKKEEIELTYIVCQDAEKTFYDIHDFLYEKTDFYDKFCFPTTIGADCNIAPTAIIEEGVKIGNRVVIGHNSVIKHGTVIGDDCVIGCNSTIGSEGFQILRIQNVNRKVVHCGRVVLGDKVYIGDNTDVCNSLFEGSTKVGTNAKVDNLVHIAHNVVVGDNAVITAGTILCGSSIVENNAWIGVNSSVLNRVRVGDDSKIGIGSVVTRDIPENALAYGVPAKVKRQL